MFWYVGALLNGVIGCTIVLPSHDISPVCAFTHMTYSVVDHVLTTVFHISFGAFGIVSDLVLIDFASR